ncbi:alpha/beta hydrolase family protein [Leuconostoc falkenbergense]|nr:S9 family peptidase [Leuconostoc falkenbergense]KDA47326.1 Acylamino-acid-releasing enzyme [Leuconostoc pseudomesenteroides 1159]KDA49550.1 Acylamino-acid-releasing enzyme [Leuconostoc pseudomesenteroides PS12]OQJ67722.1 dipeptidyl aminopeptidase [Leuconostoc pseudomesenteroides]ORM43093.1 dipeptidyl aminopeptidase [Leuconostoc sp. BM2]CCJ65605.1 Acylamino-acid-releasing enzyme [Leuconostoc pseudomesenteroides 4882]
MKKLDKSLFNIKSLSQLIKIGEIYYFTQTQLRDVENDTQHSIWKLADGQTSLIAEDAWAPQNANGQLAYLQKIDGVAQLFVAGEQKTFEAAGIHQYTAKADNDHVYYLTMTVHQSPTPILSQRPTPRRITEKNYKADGYGLIDESTQYRITYLDISKDLTKVVLKTTTRTTLLDQFDHKLLLTQTDNIAGLGESNKTFLLVNGQTIEVSRDLPNGLTMDGVFDPLGEKIALIAHDEQYTNARIFGVYLYDIKRDTLTPIFDSDVDALQDTMSDVVFLKSVHQLLWLNDTEIEFVATYHGHNRLYRLTTDGILTLLDDTQRAILSFTSEALITSYTNIPSQIENRQGEILYRPDSKEAFIIAQKYQFASEDGSMVDGWLMRAQQQPAPTLLYIHGGPHAAYADAFFWEFQMWVALGYNVVFTNPHGSTSYGQDFVKSVIGHYGEQDYRDVMTGFEAAISKFPGVIDADNIFVAGGSYGGYMTTWIIGHDHRFKAAVAQRPVINWISMFGTSDIGYDFTKTELKLDLQNNNISKLWAASPLAYAKHVRTPILLLHGEYDLRTPLGQSEEYFMAIKTQTDTPIELVRLPESFHGVSRNGRPNLRIARIEVMNNWFSKFKN